MRRPDAPEEKLVARSDGATHPGCVRELNEDNAHLDDRTELWAVSDGMGGHDSGDYASAVVIDHLRRVRANQPTPRSLTLDIEDRLEEANAQLREEARRRGVDSIGATIACVAKFGNHALVVWAGDSRVYLMRTGKKLRQVTSDHTIVQDLIDAGRLDPDEAERHPMAHAITRAVGAEDRLELDYTQMQLRCGDRILLCSDGLTRSVSDAAISSALAPPRSRDAAIDALIGLTLDAGAPDNVTVVIVDIR